MAPLDRDQVFQIRLSADERALLNELADARGVTASDLIRLMLRERTGADNMLELERQRVGMRLKIAWRDLSKLAVAKTKREREERRHNAASALAHAHEHVNFILRYFGLKELQPMSEDESR